MRYVLFSLFCLAPFWLGAQTVDSVALRQVDSLNALCEALLSAEKYEEALVINEAALQKTVNDIGRSKSITYGTVCLHRAYIFYFKQKADFAEAKKWALANRDVYAQVSDRSSLGYGRSCFFLGCLCFQMNQEQSAEAFLSESLSTFEQVAGRGYADYAASILVLGALYQRRYYYRDNECDFLEKALPARVLAFEGRPAYVRALQNVGDFFTTINNFEGAETLLTKAKALRAESDKESLAYAEVLLLLSDLYRKWGRYEQAQPLVAEAIEVVKRKVGRGHPAYALALNKAALLYQETDSSRARQYRQEAGQILANTKGELSDYYIAAVNNLADIYMLRGDYSQVGILHRISRKFLEGMLGVSSPDYSNTDLANVGFVTTQDRELMLFEEIQKIMRHLLASDQSLDAGAVAFLAEIFLMKGGYEQAKSGYQEVAAAYKKIMDEQDRRYAATLDTLNPIPSSQNKSASALKVFKKNNYFGDNGLADVLPECSQSLRSFAFLYDQRDQSEQTGVYWAHYDKIANRLVKKTADYASEHRFVVGGTFYQPMPSSRITNLFEMLQQSPHEALGSACYDDALFFKGFFMENAQTLWEAANGFDPLPDTIANDDHPRFEGFFVENARTLSEAKNLLDSLRITYVDWLSTQRQLVHQYTLPLSEQKGISVLTAKMLNCEEALNLPLMRLSFQSSKTHWKDVQNKLKKGEVAIEFVAYPKGAAKENTCYVALVLLPDARAPLFIPLFKERDLVALLQDKGKNEAESYYNALYDLKQIGGHLYNLIWKPLVAFLPLGAKVYFSPAGLMHRLNLCALPTPEGNTIGGKWGLIQLNSTRQLTISTTSVQAATAALYGGIEYNDAVIVTTLSSPAAVPTFPNRGGEPDSTLRGNGWGYLFWTKMEVNNANRTLRQTGFTTDLKMGIDATEASLKALGTAVSPRVLHIATHGYFFPDPAAHGNPEDGNQFRINEHPMIRSGLILAGGNHAWKTGRPLHEGQEDGVLTAFEVSQMNLFNTELVVLSACETGLGDIQSREGVYGLQRAFKIAGARYLIMSLWQVPDRPTQLFMTTFYKRWLDDKMTIPEAFRATQAELKAKYGEAFKWAGFVLVE